MNKFIVQHFLIPMGSKKFVYIAACVWGAKSVPGVCGKSGKQLSCCQLSVRGCAN